MSIRGNVSVHNSRSRSPPATPLLYPNVTELAADETFDCHDKQDVCGHDHRPDEGGIERFTAQSQEVPNDAIDLCDFEEGK